MAERLGAVRRRLLAALAVVVALAAGYWFLLRGETVEPHLPHVGPTSHSELQQDRVLRAAPPQLRPYIESSSYGDDGVDVMLKAGIELRFGDAARVAAKWKAVAAVLADPTVTTLDYIDVLVPSRPTIGGSGHTLPPPP
jgi:cell division septal protein FtsQ